MKKNMTKYSFMLLGLLAVPFFAGCDDDDSNGADNGRRPLVMEAYYKAFGTGEETVIWNNTTIPLAVFVADGKSGAAVEPYSNIKYFACGTTDDAHIVAENDAQVPFMADGASWNVACYSPYVDDCDGHVTIDVSRQGTLNSRSHLYARSGGITYAANKTRFTLRPVLASVLFRFYSKGASSEDMDEMRFCLANVPGSADLDIRSGVLTVGNNILSSTGVTLRTHTDTETKPSPGAGISGECHYCEGYLLPTASTEGYQAVITLPGDVKYTIDLARYTAILSSGTRYEFDVVISPDGVTCNMTSGQIDDWTQGGGDIFLEVEEPNENNN